MPMIMRRRSNPQKGIALIESLVSLLVLALGVLGLLGMQLRTMTENQTANYRLIAARLSEDLFERIKTNPGGMGGLAQYTVGWGAATAAGTNCATAVCNATQKAAWDLVQWKAVVAASLPAGQATSFIAPSDTRQLGIMIAWRANERSTSSGYTSWFNVNVSDGGVTVSCPADRICHLAYGQP